MAITVTPVQISSLPASGALDGSELVPVVKGGVTSQATADQFVTLASGVIVPVAVAAAVAAAVPAAVAAAVPLAVAEANENVVTDPSLLFTDVTQGVVPASGGGTSNFLRADGTWAAAGGGGGVETGTFTGTLSSGGSSGNATFTYQKVGQQITIFFDDDVGLFGPSVTIAGGQPLLFRGLPVDIQPAAFRDGGLAPFQTNTGRSMGFGRFTGAGDTLFFTTTTAANPVDWTGAFITGNTVQILNGWQFTYWVAAAP
jgi:hypothetical protein